MLSVGRSLGVEPADRVIRRVHDARQLGSRTGVLGLTQARCAFP